MAYDSEIARTQYENYRYCYDNGHHEWVILASRCFDFWRGRQWEHNDLRYLDIAKRPHMSFNIIESLIRAMKGVQRSLRNDVRFMPVSNASAELAQAQDALWMHTQAANQLDFLESDVFERGAIMGRAYYDCRMDFDDNLQGNVKITTPRSQDVILDPVAHGYDPDTWPQVYTRKWANLLDIEHLFGKDAASELSVFAAPSWYEYDDVFMASTLGYQPMYAFPPGADEKLVRGLLVLDRQYWELQSREVFIDTKTGDTSIIPKTWDRSRIQQALKQVPDLSTMRKKVKALHWTVTCEGQKLFDGESPYQHMTIVPFFPTFLDGVSMGTVESLLDPQLLYNKMTSQELHIINTTANSGYKVKAGALQNMTPEELETRGSSSGFVAVLDEMANLDKFTANQLPAGHERLSMKADAIMRSLAGVANGTRGFAREDVSGDAIESNQAGQQINFAGPLSNLHRTKQLLATRSRELCRDYMTETRALMINRGSMYNPKMDTVTINQPTAEGKMLNDITQGEYTTVLVPAPSRTTMTESEFDFLVDLREKLGIQIPDEMMIELSPIPDKGRLIHMLQGSEKAKQEQTQLEQQTAQANLALLQARTQKESSGASLNSARAGKAQVEAQNDPDAAYERVESARIASDHQIQSGKQQLDWAKLGMQRKQQTDGTALQLTKMDHDASQGAMDRAHERSENTADRATSLLQSQQQNEAAPAEQ